LAQAHRVGNELHDLYANHRSDIAEEGLRYFSALYEIESEARELKLVADGRRLLRQQRSKPIAEAWRQWLTRQRGQVPDGSATRKAIDYSLGRWAALLRYLDDGELPIDNNHRIRPVALGRSNWLFAGSLRAGQRAAAVMNLIQSAKLNGHDPYRYLKDVLKRLPTQPASRVEELLPHRWQLTPPSH
jgi:transposase